MQKEIIFLAVFGTSLVYLYILPGLFIYSPRLPRPVLEQ